MYCPSLMGQAESRHHMDLYNLIQWNAPTKLAYSNHSEAVQFIYLFWSQMTLNLIFLHCFHMIVLHRLRQEKLIRTHVQVFDLE